MKFNNSAENNNLRFLIDGMHGTLARKLRILGYDTWYDSESTDAQLLDNAKRTNRWLVTSDIELYLLAKKRGTQTVLIKSGSERERLFEVFSKIGLTQITRNREARCSLCNGQLVESGRLNKVLPILTCPQCGKDYWKGSHWNKMSKLFDEVNQLLQERGRSQA